MISVGIDIGQFSIKIAEIDASTKSYSLTRFHEIPLSQDPNKDRKIEIVDHLRNLISQYDPSQTHFIFSLPDWQVSMRRKIFPFKERHKILKSLPFELEEDIPFSQEDAIFEAKICRYVGNMAEILAIAAPQENVAERVQLAGDVAADPHLITVDGMALSSLMSQWQDSPPQQEPPAEDEGVTPEPMPLQILLNLGHQTSSVLFMSNGVLKAIRNIDWGGQLLAEAVAKAYSIHPVEALKEVQKKSFLLLDNEGASKDQISFSDTLKTVVDLLSHELKLTILEVETELEAKVKAAFLSGGVSLMKNLSPYLTQKLEITVNRFQHLHRHPHISVENSATVEAKSAVAVALAIEGIRRPRNPAVNLLKGVFAKEGEGFRPIVEKWKHAASVFATAIVVLFTWGYFRTDYARFMADEAHLEMKRLGQEVAGLSRLNAGYPSKIRPFLRQQEANEKNRASAEKVNDINSAIFVLNYLSQALPKSNNMAVDVKKFLVEKETVEIEGEVTGRQAIETIRKAIQGLAKGEVKTLRPGFQPAPGRATFGFRFSIDRMDGGA